MDTDRIKEIQQETAYPNSVSVQQALLTVWNECEQERVKNCSIPAVMGSLPDDAKIAEVARNYFPFEKLNSTNTGGMDVNYPKQYGFILGAKWIIGNLKGQ